MQIPPDAILPMVAEIHLFGSPRSFHLETPPVLPGASNKCRDSASSSNHGGCMTNDIYEIPQKKLIEDKQ